MNWPFVLSFSSRENSNLEPFPENTLHPYQSCILPSKITVHKSQRKLKVLMFPRKNNRLHSQEMADFPNLILQDRLILILRKFQKALHRSV